MGVFLEPHYSEAINVRGTINVLEAARMTGNTQADFMSEDFRL